MGYETLGYEILGYKTLGYEILGYKTLSYKTLGYKTLGEEPKVMALGLPITGDRSQAMETTSLNCSNPRIKFFQS